MRKEKVWTTNQGKMILLSKMDDNHLKNTIHLLYKTAKFQAINEATNYMNDVELKRFQRRQKLERILNDETLDLEYDIIWEKFVHHSYWDLVYEQKKRQKLLFR